MSLSLRCCIHSYASREYPELQTEAEVRPVAEDLAQALFDHIPVGVGSQGIIPTTMNDLEAALEMGMDYSIREACSYVTQFTWC